MKILFIGKEYRKITDGGTTVIKRNLNLLESIFGEENIEQFLVDTSISRRKKFFCMLRLSTIGFNKKRADNLVQDIEKNRYKIIFIDNSLLGKYTKVIKKAFPNIRIVVFFHNIEYMYFKEKLKVEGIQNIVALPYSYINEKLTIKNADEVIVLNKRDSNVLEKIYSRKADLILPLTLEDRYILSNENIMSSNNMEITYIFIGSNFYANIEGISWFIENVSQKVSGKLQIIGSGMEILREKYKNFSNVEVLGFVDDISYYYVNADFVIIPIFSGSGMKTKTTEALMYGKTIFGTSEAFEGFDLDYEKVGGLCNSKEEFVCKIEDYIKVGIMKYNDYSRKTYLAKYSNKAVKKKLKLFLTQ